MRKPGNRLRFHVLGIGGSAEGLPAIVVFAALLLLSLAAVLWALTTSHADRNFGSAPRSLKVGVIGFAATTDRSATKSVPIPKNVISDRESALAP